MTVGLSNKRLSELAAAQDLRSADALYLARDERAWQVSGAVLRAAPLLELVIAGEVIPGLRALRIVDGLAWRCDALDAAQVGGYVGIGLHAVNPDEALIYRLAGVLEDPSWSWLSGPVYCGSGGILTQDPQGLAWQQVIGWALGPTRLLLQFHSPILLA